MYSYGCSFLVLSSSLTVKVGCTHSRRVVCSVTPHHAGISSLMSNSRSAMTSFPGSNKVRLIRIPQCLVLASRVGRILYIADNSILSWYFHSQLPHHRHKINRWYRKRSQVVQIRETWNWEIPNLWAMSTSNSPHLKRTKWSCSPVIVLWCSRNQQVIWANIHQRITSRLQIIKKALKVEEIWKPVYNSNSVSLAKTCSSHSTHT